MAGYIGKTTNRLNEVTDAQTQAERDDLMGPMPGVIVSYDAARGVANVKPLIKKRKWDGSDLEFPELIDVPVDLPRTGNAGLTFPIPPGTRVTLTPQMRSMENYDTEDNGAQSEPRSFNLSDMRASIAGGDSAADAMQNVDADNTHLRFDAGGQYGLKGSPDGKVALHGSEGNIYEILADVVEILGQLTTTVSSGSSSGVWPITQQAQLAALAAKLRAMQL